MLSAEEVARGHEALRGKSILVADTAMWLGNTGNYERLFWNVAAGRGFVGLGPVAADRPTVLCVFRGGRPTGTNIGDRCCLEGMVAGPTIAGTPVLVDCDWADEGR
jgi:hypothetical protein